MDRGGVGRHEGIEFTEWVGHLPTVEGGDEHSFLLIDAHYGSEVAVEDIPVVVVDRFHHAITGRELPPKPLDRCRRVRIQNTLKLHVEVASTKHAPDHWTQHLHVFKWIEPEATGN